ncbi:hypothetical protein TNCV_4384741 [Trichonephila clavipes]|nr:hypothetical protein TNCV_4384741 [Trichonephila clavipes]
MPDYKICQRLYRRLCETRSFLVIRHDSGRQRAVRSPSLDESIFNVMADRPESSTRAVAHHVKMSHQTVSRAIHENRLHLPFSASTNFESADYLLRLLEVLLEYQPSWTTCPNVDITELEVKLKKIDQLRGKIEELKELLFGLETANPTEEAEFEEDLYKCETRLDDLEVRVKKLINSINVSLSVTAVEKNKYENGTFVQTKIPPIILPTFSENMNNLVTLNPNLTI